MGLLKGNIKHRLYTWIGGFIEVLDGLIIILGFGFLYSNFSFRYMFWYSKREIEEQIKNKQ